MNKKIKSLIIVTCIALVAAFTFTGCGEDPLEVFNKATKNLCKAKDLSFDGQFKANVDMGSKIEVSGDLDVEYIKDEDLENSEMVMKMTASAMGQKLDYKAYIKDKKIYVDANGEKTIQELDTSDKALKSISNKLNKGDIDKIDKYVKSSKMDGNKITLKLDTKKMVSKALKESSKALEENETMNTYKNSLNKVEFKDTTLKATVKDDNFTSLKCIIPMEFDMSELTGNNKDSKMKINLTFNMKNIKVNSNLKINFPDFTEFGDTSLDNSNNNIVTTTPNTQTSNNNSTNTEDNAKSIIISQKDLGDKACYVVGENISPGKYKIYTNGKQTVLRILEGRSGKEKINMNINFGIDTDNYKAGTEVELKDKDEIYIAGPAEIELKK